MLFERTIIQSKKTVGLNKKEKVLITKEKKRKVTSNKSTFCFCKSERRQPTKLIIRTKSWSGPNKHGNIKSRNLIHLVFY